MFIVNLSMYLWNHKDPLFSQVRQQDICNLNIILFQLPGCLIFEHAPWVLQSALVLHF